MVMAAQSVPSSNSISAASTAFAGSGTSSAATANSGATSNLAAPAGKRPSTSAKTGKMTVGQQHTMLKEARKARNAVLRQIEVLKQALLTQLPGTVSPLPGKGTEGGTINIGTLILNFLVGPQSKPVGPAFRALDVNSTSNLPLLSTSNSAVLSPTVALPILGGTTPLTTALGEITSGGQGLTTLNSQSPMVPAGAPTTQVREKAHSFETANPNWNLPGATFPIFDAPKGSEPEPTSLVSSFTQFLQGLWSSVTSGIGRLLFGASSK